MAGVAYLVTMCSQPIAVFRGVTDALGDSAYFATPTATNIEIYVDYASPGVGEADTKDADGHGTIIPADACSAPEEAGSK